MLRLRNSNEACRACGGATRACNTSGVKETALPSLVNALIGGGQRGDGGDATLMTIDRVLDEVGGPCSSSNKPPDGKPKLSRVQLNTLAGADMRKHGLCVPQSHSKLASGTLHRLAFAWTKHMLHPGSTHIASYMNRIQRNELWTKLFALTKLPTGASFSEMGPIGLECLIRVLREVEDDIREQLGLEKTRPTEPLSEEQMVVCQLALLIQYLTDPDMRYILTVWEVSFKNLVHQCRKKINKEGEVIPPLTEVCERLLQMTGAVIKEPNEQESTKLISVVCELVPSASLIPDAALLLDFARTAAKNKLLREISCESQYHKLAQKMKLYGLRPPLAKSQTARGSIFRLIQHELNGYGRHRSVYLASARKSRVWRVLVNRAEDVLKKRFPGPRKPKSADLASIYAEELFKMESCARKFFGMEQIQRDTSNPRDDKKFVVCHLARLMEIEKTPKYNMCVYADLWRNQFLRQCCGKTIMMGCNLKMLSSLIDDLVNLNCSFLPLAELVDTAICSTSD